MHIALSPETLLYSIMIEHEAQGYKMKANTVRGKPKNSMTINFQAKKKSIQNLSASKDCVHYIQQLLISQEWSKRLS